MEKSSSPHSCLLIILIFAFILGGLIAVIGVVTGAEKENVMSKIDQFSAITPLILGWLYSCLTESSRFRATVGKLAVGVVVTDLEGNRVTFARASGRYFAKILSSIPLGFGYVMAGITSKKQALHDKIVQCLVINK